MSLTVEIKTLAHFGDLELPKYETVLAAGADLRAAVPADAPMVLEPGARALVPTGMAMALPAGYEAQIRPRSGLAYKGQFRYPVANVSPVNFDCEIVQTAGFISGNISETSELQTTPYFLISSILEGTISGRYQNLSIRRPSLCARHL